MFVSCGCLSSVEYGAESVEVSVRRWDREVVTCGCLFSGEAGIEAAGVVSGWFVGFEGLVVTCGCLSSGEAGVEAAGGLSVAGWSDPRD